MLTDGTISESERLVLRRQIRACLPFLRRFARAVTGDQHIADTAVLFVMNDVLQSTDQVIHLRSLKPLLYRRLLVNLARLPEVGSTEAGSVGRTPKSRLADLLARVEKLTRLEIAEVLETKASDLDALFAEARLLSKRQTRRGVLVVEDEPLISMQLEEIVRWLGHTDVRTAVTMAQAVSAAAAQLPQLVLSDVQLADGSSGIDAVEAITHAQNASIVFITAYPERLLTGTRKEPAFLIAKPFDAEAVAATIDQALLLDSRPVG